MLSDQQRVQFRLKIDLMATKEDYDAIVRDLKEFDDIEGTHDLAEEAYMVAGARGLL